VPGLARSVPVRGRRRDGAATLGKVDGTGGSSTVATATEQLLYEVTDPHGYLTPTSRGLLGGDARRDFAPIASPSLARAGVRARTSSRSASGTSRLRRRRRDRVRRRQRVARAELAGAIVRERLDGASTSCAST
jgi:hypothetical protein